MENGINVPAVHGILKNFIVSLEDLAFTIQRYSKRKDGNILTPLSVDLDNEDSDSGEIFEDGQIILIRRKTEEYPHRFLKLKKTDNGVEISLFSKSLLLLLQEILSTNDELGFRRVLETIKPLLLKRRKKENEYGKEDPDVSIEDVHDKIKSVSSGGDTIL